MTTDRNHNRSRGMRSFTRVTGDCSVAGTRCRTAGCQSKGGDAAMPIWLAALMASPCQATVDGEDHAVSWDCIAGRALYTNHGTVAERIEPLGVQLQGGHTLAVYWQPGETSYTVEVYSQSNHFCA
jgi:hypothetical protein